jgi:hypothetical protein
MCFRRWRGPAASSPDIGNARVRAAEESDEVVASDNEEDGEGDSVASESLIDDVAEESDEVSVDELDDRDCRTRM